VMESVDVVRNAIADVPCAKLGTIAEETGATEVGMWLTKEVAKWGGRIGAVEKEIAEE